jgi:hypothetical protein
MWKTVILAFAVVCLQLAWAQQQRSGFEDDPCKKRSKLSFDAQYCDRYWECIDDEAIQFDCPNGLVFKGKRDRGVTGGCDYPWRSDNCAGKTLANAPIQTEHCDWLYGIFGHETSCTRYWTCWNGTATEQFCIGGLLYNEETRSCDWPENVEGCQKHPLCKDNPNGNVALGKSCNRYWHCQGGYPRLQRCPAMLVFDKQSLRCVVPPTEDCEVPSTTTETPQDGEDNGDEDGDDNGVQQPQQQQQQRPRHQQQQSNRPIPIGGPIPIGTQRFSPQQQPAQQQQSAPQFSLPQIPGGAIPLPTFQQAQQQQQQQQQQQRNRFQQ